MSIAKYIDKLCSNTFKTYKWKKHRIVAYNEILKHPFTSVYPGNRQEMENWDWIFYLTTNIPRKESFQQRWLKLSISMLTIRYGFVIHSLFCISLTGY